MSVFEGRPAAGRGAPRPGVAWSAWLVLAMSLVATGGTAWLVERVTIDRDRARFDNATRATEDTIRDRIDTYVAILRGAAGLHAALEDRLTRERFRAYVGRLEVSRRFPGAQGIGLCLRVAAADVPALERRMRAQGYPRFRAWPVAPEGGDVQAVVLLEPLDRRNQAALGFDMSSEPVRRRAMDQACDAGQSALSGKVTLVQEVDRPKQAGFLLYAPVYRGGEVPADVAARRRDLLGFVFAPFRADDFLAGLHGRETPRLSVEVYDGPEVAPEALLARLGDRTARPRFTAVRTIDVAGHPWSVAFSSLPAFESASPAYLVPYILGGGATISLLLFVIARSLARARLEAEERGEALRRAAAHLRLVTDTLPALIAYIGTDRRYRYVNATYGEWIGRPRGELEGHTMAEIFGPAYELVRPHVDAALRGERVSFDAGLEYAAGVRDVSVTYVPDRGPEGRVEGFVSLVVDVTERKRADRERAELLRVADEARRNAEAANRVKDEFLATLSHELRTPLTAVLGWARLLRSGRLDAEQREKALEVIERNALLQSQLVEDLLDVSRIVAGKLRIEPTPVDLASLVRAAVESVRPSAAAKGIRLRVDAPPGAFVLGDPARLQQVAWNLLSNAIKFTPAGGDVEATIASDPGGLVELRVTDTGKGIRADFLPHVFEAFRQAEAPTTRTTGGVGLGLAIVRHLVELHGGEVRAESEGAGRGATFRVRLPRAVPALPPGIVREEGARPSLVGLRVLLVEDDPDARELFATVLERHGAEVVSTASAREAIAALDGAASPDVLLTDIGLPGEDGYSLIERVRARPAARGGRVPAVALTAFARDDDRERALAAGFAVHLPKPIDPASLVSVVARTAREGDGTSRA